MGSSAPEEWVFDTGEKGKPYLSNGHQPLHFNVSHTHNLIALALSQHYAIGVDVEHTLRNSDTINIADRYFSCHELEELHALPIAQQENHFFDYWTLKESYIKACGVGLSIPLDSFSFHVDRSTDSLINSNVRLTFREDRNDQTDHWHSSLLQLGDVHRGALSIHTLDKLPSQAMSIRCFIAQNTMHNMTPFIETSLPLPTANSQQHTLVQQIQDYLWNVL
ncbi:MAG: 4'-phosphopantetheinyl transferase superfamily protein [Pseudomonadota bacterium]